MSASTSTAAQPALHADNITAHPGSTLAGIGVIAATVGSMLATTPLPTTTAGWVMFAAGILGGLGGMFGK